ncbi:MAG TPA: serine/threonine-protein kinase [Gemmatimonadales bacterium]|nr:serine/threonine-protein kinase [Gemmatimonadales bacterium]
MTTLDDGALNHLRRVLEVPEPADDRYRVERLLGEGGMGAVYLATDRRLRREVALKVLRPDLGSPEAGRRLQREARIIARLEHPGIVPVHDVGTLRDGRLYYVMKLVRGTGLDAFARGATRAETLRVFLQVCDTVRFAHAHGVVHRDLKPSNIMVGAFGEVLVLDWGIARVVGAEPPEPENRPAETAGSSPVGERTSPGLVLGTPGFMAPEQAAGSHDLVDFRTDVYALGAVLRAIVTGSAGAPVPRPLAAIWTRALDPDPELRYAGPAELAADVRHFLDAEPVSAYRETPWERAGRLYQKYQTAILLVLAYLTMRLIFLVARGL